MNLRPKIKIALLRAVLVLAAVSIWITRGSHAREATITYTQFLNQVQAGQVAQVTIAAGSWGPNSTDIRLKDGQAARTVLPADYSSVLAVLAAKLVDVEIRNASAAPLGLLGNAVPFLLLLGFWVFLMGRRVFPG